MTALNRHLIGGGTPLLEYRIYTVKILFPNLEEPTVLQMNRPDLVRKEKGLNLFGQLVRNKTFLVLFIRMLESSHCFSMKDRLVSCYCKSLFLKNYTVNILVNLYGLDD